MQTIDYRGGSMPDVMSRSIRADDLPRPQTNAQADRTTRDVINARQRALMRVSGFGDSTADGTGAPIADATAGGGAVAAAGVSGNLLGSIVVGVGSILAATFILRMFDGGGR